MSYEIQYAIEEAGVALATGLITGLPSFLVSIVAYVLTSLALYTIAKRRCIGHAWMSWVPLLNVWIIGSLSDQFRYVTKGQIKSKRKLLLVLEILAAVFAAAIIVICIVMVVNLAVGAAYGVHEDLLLEDAIGPVLAVVGLALPLMGVAIASMVVRYMAMYDIYTSCDPNNNVLFLVLSILFHVTEPFFLFFSRQKDLGMPPRKRPAEPLQGPDMDPQPDSEVNYL